MAQTNRSRIAGGLLLLAAAGCMMAAGLGEVGRAYVYSRVWFYALWFLVGGVSLARLARGWGRLGWDWRLLHLGGALVLAGAAGDLATARQGQLVLAAGERCAGLGEGGAGQDGELRIEKIELGNAPGEVATVVSVVGRPGTVRIEPNRPLYWAGWTLRQSGWQADSADRPRTVLQATRAPLLPVVWAGYLLLAAGWVWGNFSARSSIRRGPNPPAAAC